MPQELDPALFDSSAIAPETRRFNEELEKTLAETPSILDVSPAVVRQARIEGRGIWTIQRLGPSRRAEAGALVMIRRQGGLP